MDRNKYSSSYQSEKFNQEEDVDAKRESRKQEQEYSISPEDSSDLIGEGAENINYNDEDKLNNYNNNNDNDNNEDDKNNSGNNSDNCEDIEGNKEEQNLEKDQINEGNLNLNLNLNTCEQEQLEYKLNEDNNQKEVLKSDKKE